MTRMIGQYETNGGQDELRRDDYFPTLVFSTKLHDSEAVNKDILAAVRGEQDRDQKGIERSNFRSMGGWHSHNSLHKDEKFNVLTNRVHKMLGGVSSNLGYDNSRRLRITTMWAISNPPFCSNRSHIHPGALWSGVYYVQAPEGAGQIEFLDPRVVTIMNGASYQPKQKRKTECWTKVKIKPVPGKLLIFPSWLYHAVDPNLAPGESPDADRVIISFNINQVKKPAPKK